MEEQKAWAYSQACAVCLFSGAFKKVIVLNVLLWTEVNTVEWPCPSSFPAVLKHVLLETANNTLGKTMEY